MLLEEILEVTETTETEEREKLVDKTEPVTFTQVRNIVQMCLDELDK
jgi:hypothetical protein